MTVRTSGIRQPKGTGKWREALGSRLHKRHCAFRIRGACTIHQQHQHHRSAIWVCACSGILKATTVAFSHCVLDMKSAWTLTSTSRLCLLQTFPWAHSESLVCVDCDIVACQLDTFLHWTASPTRFPINISYLDQLALFLDLSCPLYLRCLPTWGNDWPDPYLGHLCKAGKARVWQPIHAVFRCTFATRGTQLTARNLNDFAIRHPMIRRFASLGISSELIYSVVVGDWRSQRPESPGKAPQLCTFHLFF